MVQTRTRDHAPSAKGPTTPKAPNKAPKGVKKTEPDHVSVAKKHTRNEDGFEEGAEDEDSESPAHKKAKRDQDNHAAQAKGSKDKSAVEKVISKYGVLPLSDMGLSQPTAPTPETILALIFHAMLTSARISHELAYKSVKCLIEAGYHDVEVLSKSTWQERTEVLTKGGYTRYRERTATALGELAELVTREYEQRTFADQKSVDGDLNYIVKRADSSPSKIRGMIKGIKGIGNVGTDIFFDTAQGVWSCLAPFIDPRSLKTAEQCGLGNNIDQLWQDVDRDAVKMCKLASALTTIRLEKKEREFQ